MLMGKHTNNESPIACDLTALNAEQRARHKIVMQQLHASSQEVQELFDGYAFRFSNETSTILTAAEFVTLERLCCPFLNFVLEVECEGGPVWLRVTGREGVKHFVKTEFGIR
jgi:hypothetical protein